MTQKYAKVGDTLYHLRYGALRVVGFSTRSSSLSAEPRELITSDEAKKIMLTEPEKLYYICDAHTLFHVNSLGYWIHTSAEDAILNNRNSPQIEQAQTPKAMNFPIKGYLFHESYKAEIYKMLCTLAKIICMDLSQIDVIQQEYDEKKTAVDNDKYTVLKRELEIFIAQVGNSTTEEKQIGAQSKGKIPQHVRTALLAYLKEALSKANFTLKDLKDIVIAAAKLRMNKDADFKDIIEWLDSHSKSIFAEKKVAVQRVQDTVADNIRQKYSEKQQLIYNKYEALKEQFKLSITQIADFNIVERLIEELNKKDDVSKETPIQLYARTTILNYLKKKPSVLNLFSASIKNVLIEVEKSNIENDADFKEFVENIDAHFEHATKVVSVEKNKYAAMIEELKALTTIKEIDTLINSHCDSVFDGDSLKKDIFEILDQELEIEINQLRSKEKKDLKDLDVEYQGEFKQLAKEEEVVMRSKKLIDPQYVLYDVPGVIDA